VVSSSYEVRGWTATDVTAIGTQPIIVHRRVHARRRLAFASLAIPALLFISILIIDLGRLYTGYIQMAKAVRAGAVLGSQDPSNTTGINDVVLKHESSGSSLTTLAITCTNGVCSDAKSGDDVTIKATWTFAPIVSKVLGPIWEFDPIVLSTQSTMKVL